MEQTTAFAVPPQALDLLKIHRSISRIPEEELAAHGLKRLQHDARGATIILNEREHALIKNRVHGIMNQYRGYLFAGHLDRMHQVLADVEVMTREELDRIVGRAKYFMEAGIPPIFQPEFNTLFDYAFAVPGERQVQTRLLRSFPTVDYMIQLAAATLNGKRAALAVDMTNAAARLGVNSSSFRRGIIITPTNVRDVRVFRSRAFTPEGKIDLRLARGVMWFMENHHTFNTPLAKNYVLEKHEALWPVLEDALRNVQPEHADYQTWDGSPDAVKGEYWFTYYSPADREAICATWLARQRKTARGIKSSQLKLVKAMYPEMCEGIDDELENRHREDVENQVRTAVETNRFADLPSCIFTTPKLAGLRIQAQEAFRVWCEELQANQPDQLLASIKDFTGAPTWLLHVPGFRESYEIARLRTVQRLTDEQFRRRFMDGTKWHSAASIGQGASTEAGRAFRQYILVRARAMRLAR